MTHLRVRPHGTAGQKKQWEANKHVQPPTPKYLLYSKTFNFDSGGRLFWSKGVTAKGNPPMSLMKDAIWLAKRRKRQAIRAAKRAVGGRRLTQLEYAAALQAGLPTL